MTQANIIFTNATVFTANPDQLSVKAIAIHGNRIVFVGENADAETFRGPNTRVIDANGQTVIHAMLCTSNTWNMKRES